MMYHTRHTLATLVLSTGENMGWVQQMMGQAPLKMTPERYHRFIPKSDPHRRPRTGQKTRKMWNYFLPRP
jgi:integrase